MRDIIGPLTQRNPAQLLEFTQMTGDLVKAMRACPQPIVAAIDGVCAGAGAILAMASDMRYGTRAQQSRVSCSCESAWPAATWARARCCRGSSATGALGAAVYGPLDDADEALAWGFYNAIARARRVLGARCESRENAGEWPVRAHAMTKRMLHEEWNMALDDAIDAEARAQAKCMETDDFRRAYEAFVAGERPVFAGD